jgi:hypothetical protein
MPSARSQTLGVGAKILVGPRMLARPDGVPTGHMLLVLDARGGRVDVGCCGATLRRSAVLLAWGRFWPGR